MSGHAIYYSQMVVVSAADFILHMTATGSRSTITSRHVLFAHQRKSIISALCPSNTPGNTARLLPTGLTQQSLNDRGAKCVHFKK